MSSSESHVPEESAQALRARFTALPERQQALLALCLDGGCDVRAAASMLEMSFAEAQAELRRAIGTLRGNDGAAPLALAQLQTLLGASLTAPPELSEALDLTLPGAPCAGIRPEPHAVARLEGLLIEKPHTFVRSRLFRVAAALLLGAMGLTAGWFLRSGDSGTLRVVSGRIRIDGHETAVVPGGARVENAENVPAELRLDDGSRITLQPSSVLRAKPRTGKGAAFELESGHVRFVCAKQGQPLSVHTAVADVTAVNAEFTVDLNADAGPFEEGDEDMSRHSMMALAVAVLAGSVSVQYDGKQVAISAGGSRLFAAEGKGDKFVDKGVDKGEKVTKPMPPPPQEIALDQVPEALVSAAQALVPGIVLSAATVRHNPGDIEYRLEGVSGGVSYDVRLSANPAKRKGGGAPNPKGEGKVKGEATGDVKSKPKGDVIDNVKNKGEGKGPAKEISKDPKDPDAGVKVKKGVSKPEEKAPAPAPVDNQKF